MPPKRGIHSLPYPLSASTRLLHQPGSLSVKEYSITKEDAAKLTITLTIKGSNGLASKAAVSLLNDFGTAAAGTDITFTAPVTVTFDPNSADNTTKTIEIPIANRAGEQNDRYFALALTGFENAEAGSISQYVAYIQDVNVKGPEATNSVVLQYTSRFTVGAGGTAKL